MKTLIALIFFSSVSAQASSSQQLLELDPYSQSSIAQYFPEAITRGQEVDEEAMRNFKKNAGKLTKESYSVNYQVLVPHLIELVQQQQREIEQLKSGKTGKSK